MIICRPQLHSRLRSAARILHDSVHQQVRTVMCHSIVLGSVFVYVIALCWGLLSVFVYQYVIVLSYYECFYECDWLEEMYLCVCMCVCMCLFILLCMCMCCVCVCECECECVCVCVYECTYIYANVCIIMIV